jgi:Macrocin-O-methyltransferase (TylF)
MKEFNVKSNASASEINNRSCFLDLLKRSPISDAELLENLPLYLNRQTLTNLLFMNELYAKILDVNGIIIEFGVRWGRNLALYENLRGIYESFNHTRRVIGFDTFEGFPAVHAKDGEAHVATVAAYSVSMGYQKYLEQILDYHESENPIPHIKKYSLVAGDATKTLPDYLARNPQTIIALAYFDFDIYEPTKECLKAIIPYLTKGSILAFDELNYATFPGETMAVREVLGTQNIELRRSKFSGYQSYAVWTGGADR